MTKPSLMRRAGDADVSLMLEGTSPYVRGGVSSWVNEMVRAYPSTRFSIVFLGSREEDYADAAYALPDNVVHFDAHYLYEHADADMRQPHAMEGDRAAFAHSAELHAALRDPQRAPYADGLMAGMIPMLGENGALSEAQFLTSRAAWETIVDQYQQYCTDPSFTDYF